MAASRPLAAREPHGGPVLPCRPTYDLHILNILNCFENGNWHTNRWNMGLKKVINKPIPVSMWTINFSVRRFISVTFLQPHWSNQWGFFSWTLTFWHGSIIRPTCSAAWSSNRSETACWGCKWFSDYLCLVRQPCAYQPVITAVIIGKMYNGPFELLQAWKNGQLSPFPSTHP